MDKFFEVIGAIIGWIVGIAIVGGFSVWIFAYVLSLDNVWLVVLLAGVYVAVIVALLLNTSLIFWIYMILYFFVGLAVSGGGEAGAWAFVSAFGFAFIGGYLLFDVD